MATRYALNLLCSEVRGAGNLACGRLSGGSFWRCAERPLKAGGSQDRLPHFFKTVVLILIAFANLPILFAQSTSQKIFIEPRARMAPVASAAEEPGAHLRVDASLVLIPANVSTDTGARINDLQKNNFKVFEDGVEQTISYFAIEDAPLSVGLLFDSSGSMRNKMRQAEQAAAAFFKTANREDEFFLVEFSEKAKLTVPFTADSGELMNRISRTRPAGRTSLLDAVQLALGQMKKARNSRK